MPRRRFRFRILLILVAASGILLCVGVALNRNAHKRERKAHERELINTYTMLADRYADCAAIVKKSEDKQRRIGQESAQNPELAADFAAINDHFLRDTHTRFLYYDQLSKKYRRAATRPWEAVPEDPPEPRPSPMPAGLLLEPPP